MDQPRIGDEERNQSVAEATDGEVRSHGSGMYVMESKHGKDSTE